MRALMHAIVFGLSRDYVKIGLLTNFLLLFTWLVAFFCFGPKYVGSEVLSWLFPFLLSVQASLMDRLLDQNPSLGFLKRLLVKCCMMICFRNRNNNNVQDEQSKQLRQPQNETVQM
jgi:hypothetical protein